MTRVAGRAKHFQIAEDVVRMHAIPVMDQKIVGVPTTIASFLGHHLAVKSALRPVLVSAALRT